MGVAIDDELGALAHPRGVLAARPEPALFEMLVKLARDSSVSRFVLGLPLDMKGGEGDAAKKARAFAQRLADATGLSVELWDERLTTVEAERVLRQSGISIEKRARAVDQLAAVILLESYLDSAESVA